MRWWLWNGHVCIDWKPHVPIKLYSWQIFVFISHVGNMDGHVALDPLTMAFGRSCFHRLENRMCQ